MVVIRLRLEQVQNLKRVVREASVEVVRALTHIGVDVAHIALNVQCALSLGVLG